MEPVEALARRTQRRNTEVAHRHYPCVYIGQVETRALNGVAFDQ